MSAHLAPADNGNLLNSSMIEAQGITSHDGSTLKQLSWSNQVQSVPLEQSIVPIEHAESEKKPPQQIQRGPDGKLLPGTGGLPGAGRPKTAFISEALKQALRDGKADELKETLLSLASTAKDSVRLAAIQEIADRTEGKPMQNVRHAGIFMVMAPGAEALAALDGWAESE